MCLALSAWGDWLSQSPQRIQIFNALLVAVLLAIVAKGWLLPALGGVVLAATLAPHVLRALCKTLSQPFDIFRAVARFSPLFMTTALSCIALYIVYHSEPYSMPWTGGLALFGFQLMVIALLNTDAPSDSSGA